MVVLAVASISKVTPDELWVAFDVGSRFWYIPIPQNGCYNESNTVSYSPSHAFNGCDDVFAFAGRGKKTAWVTWKSFPEVMGAFNEFLCMPSEVS